MNDRPSEEDARLLLRLWKMRLEEPLREARRWFEKSFDANLAHDFDQLYSRDSREHAHFRNYLSYWEMVASFVATGALNADLFFRTGGELLYVWEKVRDLVPRTRELRKNKLAFSNLEEVAKSYVEWMSTRAPEAYAALQERIRPPAPPLFADAPSSLEVRCQRPDYIALLAMGDVFSPSYYPTEEDTDKP